ncbi:hypothetical protein [Photobacterium angustum]|uniref:hypothetical protein n=1 Tax=Photobacterium angustum TaxID=661 RepID=UPI0005E0C92A|nr:hypothetical protein [Photobacterium angustum]KJG02898.1 hypothetical protein UB35_04125 [Photobacterium angustum]PSV62757.1 hypothetical protein CTM95_19725 [Photobacterium angustum]
MNIKRILSVLLLSTIISGCSNVSSSNVPDLPISQQTKGAIYIAKHYLPANVKYTEVGKVKANARYGYDSVVTLYPLLAEEARKIGANAIIDLYGGHTVAAFSWGAPYTGGTAIKVDNIEQLKQYDVEVY